MNKFIFLTLSILLPVSSSVILANTKHTQLSTAQNSLKHLEQRYARKIGVYAINTNNLDVIAYHEEERFPFQSTFKLLGAAALLEKSTLVKNLLKKRVYFSQDDLVMWHPITGKNIKNGMTLEDLAEAAVSSSDSPAVNLIIKNLGGIKSINDYAHSIGNDSFNLVHHEPNLNSNPTLQDDTVTPKDMAISIQKLTLGTVLPQAQRELLLQWMRNTTTSYKRMRAAAPLAWVVADKTGSGDYGIANDIGMMWSPDKGMNWSPTCKPIILAIYTVGSKKEDLPQDELVVQATKFILAEFAKKDSCISA